MKTNLEEQIITLKTNNDGVYRIRIANQNQKILFHETIMSVNKQIVLKGFSLDLHTITISPVI